MILEDAVAFLRKVQPLAQLEPERLHALARRASLDFYPKGTPVVGPDGAGQGFAHAVRKGALEADGLRFGPGELLGAHATRAVAARDTVSCLLPPDALDAALGQRQDLRDFLAGRLTPGVLELGLSGLARDIPSWAWGRPLAARSAGEAARAVAVVPQDKPVRDAARLMAESGCEALVVTDQDGRPRGVITDRDFRARAVARALPPDAPAREVMSAPVISVEARASLFEALVAMTRHNIRQVLVMDGAACAGLLTMRDVMLSRVGLPPALAEDIARARDPQDLARSASRLDALALGLLREGGRASHLGRMVGALREALAARACDLAVERLGPPPCGWSVLLLGRAARREGPALCPLWNAVVHEGHPDADAYFRDMGRFLDQAFEAANLAGAPGSPRMAQPDWRGGPAAWRRRVESWAAGGLPDPEWLDFRPVHGSPVLAEGLRAHMLAQDWGPVLTPGEAQGNPGGARSDFNAAGDDLARRVTDAVRLGCLRAGVSRIGGVERARALERVGRAGPDLTLAVEYLTARQWVGLEGQPGALDRGMERLCRDAARRSRNALVAPVRQDG